LPDHLFAPLSKSDTTKDYEKNISSHSPTQKEQNNFTSSNKQTQLDSRPEFMLQNANEKMRLYNQAHGSPPLADTTSRSNLCWIDGDPIKKNCNDTITRKANDLERHLHDLSKGYKSEAIRL